jgi:hypothetical protein
MSKGVNVVGVPRKFSLSLAPELKAQIKERMDARPLVCSSPLWASIALLTVPL